jgi:hypothetical protein
MSPLRHGVNGDEPDFVAFAMNPEVHHALAAVQVAQPAEFFAANAVIEQRRQDGAIAHTLKGVFWWCLE